MKRNDSRPGWGRGNGNLLSNVVTSENSTSTLCKMKVPSRFVEACAKIAETNKKFLDSQTFNFSDEENEEDEMPYNAEVVASIIQKFTEHYEGDGELGRTHQFLIDAVKSGTSICLICIAVVKKHDAIWNCIGCYSSFHLVCIQTWAKDSTFQESQNDDERKPLSERNWFCPKCRQRYTYSQLPVAYKCFCSKLTNPEFDPWLVPHSCGQQCHRPLQPSCGHVCNLLCHPGPCPPCPQMVQVPCHCNRQKPQARRCNHKAWSCGQICNKILSCNQHNCSKVCHAGDCSICSKQSVQYCCCGKESMERLCADLIWNCKQASSNTVCGRPFSCGHHTCERICHSGSCGPCPRSDIRSCPCGKSLSRLPCFEDVLPCGDTCDKEQACGIHLCSQRCHFGSCGMCSQMRLKKCRCGLKEKVVPCYKEFVCEKKCKRLKNCRKHPCNRKCCDGNCNSCEQLCGKPLGCHSHKCNSLCHQGPCYPCPLMEDIKCFCGHTMVTVPCGRKKLCPPPKCNQLCKKPPICHHSKHLPHKCHFGDCPTCQQLCNKTMSCGHQCLQICHSAVRIKIQQQQVRSGPWEPQLAPRTEIICKDCPPCSVPMSVTCLGKHETKDFPCFMSKPGSCHRLCGRALLCGNHFCTMECHEVLNAPSEQMAGENCSRCEEPCTLPRPKGCSHHCYEPCHMAPCPPCQQTIRLKCHCRINAIYVKCSTWNVTKDKDDPSRLSCGDKCPKLLPCGHRCQLLCHAGVCMASSKCHKKVAVRCPCKRIKKELPCNMAQKKQTHVLCDEVCKEKLKLEKKAQKESELKRKKEEEEKAREELDWYERKFHIRKRKPQKQKELPEISRSSWTDHKWTIVILISLTLILLAYLIAVM